METWTKLIVLVKFCFNLQRNILDLIDFDEYIDVTNTLKQVGYWLRKITFISVDIAGFYYDQFNLRRYCLGWLNLVLIVIGMIIAISIISNKWLYSFIDNQYLPNHFKVLSLYGLSFAIAIASYRFDCLIAEWNRNILVFKTFYYIQEDIKSKHGLNKGNYRKFSIVVKFVKA